MSLAWPSMGFGIRSIELGRTSSGGFGDSCRAGPLSFSVERSAGI